MWPQAWGCQRMTAKLGFLLEGLRAWRAKAGLACSLRTKNGYMTTPCIRGHLPVLACLASAPFPRSWGLLCSYQASLAMPTSLVSLHTEAPGPQYAVSPLVAGLGCEPRLRLRTPCSSCVVLFVPRRSWGNEPGELLNVKLLKPFMGVLRRFGVKLGKQQSRVLDSFF